MNEYWTFDFIWMEKTKDKLCRQINIHDNKRKNIIKAVNVDIDTEIYTWFKNNRGNNIPLSGNFHKNIHYNI